VQFDVQGWWVLTWLIQEKRSVGEATGISVEQASCREVQKKLVAGPFSA
jgi:hypothetical protein